MSPQPNQAHVARRARIETALSDLCRAARTQGFEARELAVVLLRLGAHYARIASWTARGAKLTFAGIWREENELSRHAGVLNEPPG